MCRGQKGLYPWGEMMYNGGNTLEREGLAREEQNRIRIKLAGKEYVVITERDEGFVLRCAEHLNRGIEEILLANPAAGTVDAALLCAMNFLEEMELKRGAAEELKRQLKTCFEEQAQWKAQERELEGAVKRLNEELAEKNTQLARRGGRN